MARCKVELGENMQLEIDFRSEEFFILIGEARFIVDQFRSVRIGLNTAQVPVFEAHLPHVTMTLETFTSLLDQLPTSYFHSFAYEPELTPLRQVMEYDRFRNQG